MNFQPCGLCTLPVVEELRCFLLPLFYSLSCLFLCKPIAYIVSINNPFNTVKGFLANLGPVFEKSKKTRGDGSEKHKKRENRWILSEIPGLSGKAVSTLCVQK